MLFYFVSIAWGSLHSEGVFLLLLEDFSDIDLWNMYVGDKEKCQDDRQNVVDDNRDRVGKGETDKVEQRVDRRCHSYGQTAVALGTAVLGHLSLGFEHVEECQADQTAKHVAEEDDNADNRLNTAEIEDNCRQNAEADHVTQRVQLNTEVLFVLGSVLLGTGNRTVKHIAKARKHQAENGKTRSAVCRTAYTEHA